MPRRFYHHCPEHSRARMVRIGQEPKHGDPARAVVYQYYLCPEGNCGWTYDLNHNYIHRGIPEDAVKAAIESGKLDSRGNLKR